VENTSPVSRRRSDFWIAFDEEVVDFMRVMLAVLFLVVASGSQALAKIQFCNKFQHPIFIALAYQQNGGWVTDGWIQVDTDKCLIDSNHPDLTSFYYYGETNVFDKKRWTWGNKREFSVKDDDGFTLRNADTQQPGARFVKFSGPNTYKLPETVVQLEFESDLSTTFVVPREDNGGPATAADTARDDCENKSGDTAIAGCTILISNNPNDAVAYLDRGIEYATSTTTIARSRIIPRQLPSGRTMPTLTTVEGPASTTAKTTIATLSPITPRRSISTRNLRRHLSIAAMCIASSTPTRLL